MAAALNLAEEPLAAMTGVSDTRDVREARSGHP